MLNDVNVQPSLQWWKKRMKDENNLSIAFKRYHHSFGRVINWVFMRIVEEDLHLVCNKYIYAAACCCCLCFAVCVVCLAFVCFSFFFLQLKLPVVSCHYENCLYERSDCANVCCAAEMSNEMNDSALSAFVCVTVTLTWTCILYCEWFCSCAHCTV